MIKITDNKDKRLRYFSFHFPLLGWGLCVQRGLPLLTLPDIKGAAMTLGAFWITKSLNTVTQAEATNSQPLVFTISFFRSLARNHLTTGQINMELRTSGDKKKREGGGGRQTERVVSDAENQPSNSHPRPFLPRSLTCLNSLTCITGPR